MKVLVTNDDGIQAEGLHALRRALAEIDGVERARDRAGLQPQRHRPQHHHPLPAVGRGGRRSTTATIGYATDGTPVDCVRFADLGLIGERPDLIVSGINHGSNLGDDITYSGTVAAALEGIVLGIPAIAHLAAVGSARDGVDSSGRSLDFTVAARLWPRTGRLSWPTTRCPRGRC